MNKIVYYLLVFYIISIPFEYYDPWAIASFFSITKIIGIIFALFSVTYFIVKKLFIIEVFKFHIPLLSLFFLVTFLSILNYESSSLIYWFNVSWFFSLISLFLLINVLIHNFFKIEEVLKLFVFSITFVEILINLGYGIQYYGNVSNVISYSSRLFFLGTNPNMVGMWGVFSTTIILHNFRTPKFFSIRNIILIVLIFLNIQLVALTGSRGAIISFFIVFLLFFTIRMLGKKIINNTVSIFFFSSIMIVLFNYLFSIEVISKRFKLAEENSFTGNRFDIWSNSLNVFLNNPLGIGETGWEKNSLELYGYYISTHNLFIYFMVVGGILGFVFFLFFLFRILYLIIKQKNEKYFFLSFSMFTILVIDFLKNGGAIDNKLNYFILSIIISIIFLNQSKKNVSN